MKLSALVLDSLMAVSVSAKSTYRISLYSKTDFQGDQATFATEYDISILPAVSLLLMLTGCLAAVAVTK
jgi:hypothetical protein